MLQCVVVVYLSVFPYEWSTENNTVLDERENILGVTSDPESTGDSEESQSDVRYLVSENQDRLSSKNTRLMFEPISCFPLGSLS